MMPFFFPCNGRAATQLLPMNVMPPSVSVLDVVACAVVVLQSSEPRLRSPEDESETFVFMLTPVHGPNTKTFTETNGAGNSGRSCEIASIFHGHSHA